MFRGLLINLLITIGSCIIPVIVGLLTYIFCDKKGAKPNSIKLLGFFFECCSPIIIFSLVYYTVGINIRSFSGIWGCIVGFTISFLGYMPRRYNLDFPFKKNFIVNTIGLLSHAFKWSFCVSMIGTYDMFFGARQLLMHLDFSGLWIAFGISFVIIFILETMKHVAKEKC